MEGVLNVMGPRGHLSLTWKEGDPESVAQAAREFAELRKLGYRAFRMNKEGEAGEELTAFAADAGEIVMVGPIAGG